MIKDFRPLSPEETAQAIDLGRGLAANWGEHFGPAEKGPGRDDCNGNAWDRLPAVSQESWPRAERFTHACGTTLCD